MNQADVDRVLNQVHINVSKLADSYAKLNASVQVLEERTKSLQRTLDSLDRRVGIVATISGTIAGAVTAIGAMLGLPLGGDK